MTSKPTTGAPGRRPASESDAVRRALLDAARECFLAKPFSSVSVRELADHAGVTPAMIHYYFDNKVGLYVALFEETVGPVLERLSQAVQAGEDMDAVVAMYLRTLNEHPWIPVLLVRDVLSGAGPLQRTFAERIAGRAGGLIRALVNHAQDQGRIQKDVDPRLAALSLVSLCLFPMVAAPVAERALDLEYDDDFIEALITHNVRLLRNGIYE